MTDDARAIALHAVAEFLERTPERPVPEAVSIGEAAKMLGVSSRTVARMNLPRNGAGKIPYPSVLRAMASR